MTEIGFLEILWLITYKKHKTIISYSKTMIISLKSIKTNFTSMKINMVIFLVFIVSF